MECGMSVKSGKMVRNGRQNSYFHTTKNNIKSERLCLFSEHYILYITLLADGYNIFNLIYFNSIKMSKFRQWIVGSVPGV